MASVVYLSLPVDGVRTTLVTQAELPLTSKEDGSAELILLFPRLSFIFLFQGSLVNFRNGTFKEQLVQHIMHF